MYSTTARSCSRFFWKRLSTVLSVIAVIGAHTGWAAFGENIEKPKPEFSRQENFITAKLIPRAKSTSVQIRFSVTGAKLLDIEAMDFEKAERPEVDIKNFKSALFVIRLADINPDGEAKISIASDFFISSTQFYIFNENLAKPWIISDAANLSLPNRVQQLVVTVKDGGQLDSDGKTDGRITLVGGPRDSFWGYALGTLFIRFFGIFIVLSILMLGMIFSGKIFQRLGRQKTTASKKKTLTPALESKAENAAQESRQTDSETAAAIAVALHLHLAGAGISPALDLAISPSSSWTLHGRAQIIDERFLVFNRKNR